MTIKILLFLLIAILIVKFSGRRVTNTYRTLYRIPEEDIVVELVDLRCETHVSGLKMGDYQFSKCDLIVTKTSLIVFGYSQFLGYTWYCRPIIFSAGTEFYTYTSGKRIVPKKVNLHSFNDSVYIEFMNSGFMDTNIDLRIYNIPEDTRKIMTFLEKNHQ